MLSRLSQRFLRPVRFFCQSNKNSQAEEQESETDYDTLFLDEYLIKTDQEPPYQPLRQKIPAEPIIVVEYDKHTDDYIIIKECAREYFGYRRTLALGIIGAFLEDSTNHLLKPWNNVSRFFKQRFFFQNIAAVSRNDPFVLHAFAKKCNFKENMSFISDWNGMLAKLLNVEHDMTDVWMGPRNFHYVATILKNEVKSVDMDGMDQLFVGHSLDPMMVMTRMDDYYSNPRYYIQLSHQERMRERLSR